MNEELKRYCDGMNAPDDVREFLERTEEEHERAKLSSVEHVIDYLCSDKRPKRLTRATFKQMQDKAHKWSQSLQKKGKDFTAIEGKDFEVTLDFNDGFRVIKLLSKREYEREGRLMSHCVSSYHERDDEIYSLRDDKNQPHATMSKNSEQIKGKGNGSINPKYVRYVVEFLEHLNIPVRDSEMRVLGYYNIESIKDKLHKGTPLFRDKYMFETEKFIGVDGKPFISLDLWKIKPLIDNSGQCQYDLQEFIVALDEFKINSKLASSGDDSKLAASGDDSKLASSGDYSQLAASGEDSQLAASGDDSQLAASGDDSQLASSGDDSQLAASGYNSKLAASGDDSQLASSGDYSQLAASGYNSKLAASCYRSQLASSGDYSQLAASGDDSQLAASGNNSKLASSGYRSQLAASGDGSQLAASGYRSQLEAKGKNSIIVTSYIGCKAKGVLGTWITLTSWIEKESEYYVKTFRIDDKKYMANTWYELKGKRIVRVEEE